MQETWLWSLVWEDPTSHGATKPMHYNDWACAPQQEKTPKWEAPAPQLEKRPHSREDSAQLKKFFFFKF